MTENYSRSRYAIAQIVLLALVLGNIAVAFVAWCTVAVLRGTVYQIGLWTSVIVCSLTALISWLLSLKAGLTAPQTRVAFVVFMLPALLYSLFVFPQRAGP